MNIPKKGFPQYAVIIQRSVSTICNRRIDKVIKTQNLGTSLILLVKVYDDFMIIENSTGLLLRKAKNIKEAVSLLDKQDAKVLKAKLADYLELTNIFKRRCYEVA